MIDVVVVLEPVTVAVVVTKNSNSLSVELYVDLSLFLHIPILCHRDGVRT